MPGQPGVTRDAALALRGGCADASGTEEHSWIGAAEEVVSKHGGVDAALFRLVQPSSEEKEKYGNVKIVLSIRSGIYRRVDAIWMR
ncbi:MAG: hypothetical protein ACREDJ_03280 [Methylocella sp.]